jgi:two-component system, cell cycle sensor histidine kinase and response regulator CckA
VKKKKPPRTKPVNPTPGVSVALLAAAFRAQSEGVFISGAKLGSEGLEIVFVNDSLCAITGHSPRQLIGASHGMLHVEPTALEQVARWLPTAQPGQSLVGEGFLPHADGRTLYTSWTLDALADARGRVTHIVGAYRDTTEKRRLQEALVHAQRLDAVGRLAGDVAHDFNNVLSIINGYCEVLATQLAAQPEMMKGVNEIHRAARQGTTLAQQLLVFGRRQALNPRVIDLNVLLRDHGNILNRLLGEAGHLELELVDEPLYVRVDPAQLTQVIINLVLNARDALREKGRVVIGSTRREVKPRLNRRQGDMPPGKYISITVADNGTGMDTGTQLHLFEPFFTTKPPGKGTGLGLALVYGVVQQSGGYISVRSELLVGTTFEIMLPSVGPPVEAPPPMATVAPLPVTRGSESVLLYEEDDVVRKMVAGILTADGYRVYAAKTAAEALNLAIGATRPVQLLIASGDRAKLAQTLRAKQPELRLLDIGQDETKHPFERYQPDHVTRLPKPFALGELLKAARKLLDA